MKLLAVSGECLRGLMPVILSLDTKLARKILVVMCGIIFVWGGGGRGCSGGMIVLSFTIYKWKMDSRFLVLTFEINIQ